MFQELWSVNGEEIYGGQWPKWYSYDYHYYEHKYRLIPLFEYFHFRFFIQMIAVVVNPFFSFRADYFCRPFFLANSILTATVYCCCLFVLGSSSCLLSNNNTKAWDNAIVIHSFFSLTFRFQWWWRWLPTTTKKDSLNFFIRLDSFRFAWPIWSSFHCWHRPFFSSINSSTKRSIHSYTRWWWWWWSECHKTLHAVY